jgi:hypothetical protein
MSWKNLRLNKKLAVGFGIVLALLLSVELWAVYGVGEIVGNAGEVITGNKLNAQIIQKEVDHLMTYRPTPTSADSARGTTATTGRRPRRQSLPLSRSWPL